MNEIQSGLETIVESLGGIPEGKAVEFWEELARKLSRIVGQVPAWSWRYPQGVLKGSIKPSKLFVSAVYALGAAIDEVPTSVVYTVQVRVYAKPETVEEGNVILGFSKVCERPGCNVLIVPWRRYCIPHTGHPPKE